MTLPRQVVIGHRTWKIKTIGPRQRPRINGLCEYEKSTLWVRLKGQSPQQQANTLLHEIGHAIWHEGNIESDDIEEHVVTVTANLMCQVIRDNPDVIDWIAEKARG